jgi:hypothetical protein
MSFSALRVEGAVVREDFGRNDQRNHHLYAVESFIPAVPKLLFASGIVRIIGRLAFETGVRQIIKQHIVRRIEQLAPALLQEREQAGLVLAELIQAVIQRKNGRALVAEGAVTGKAGKIYNLLNCFQPVQKLFAVGKAAFELSVVSGFEQFADLRSGRHSEFNQIPPADPSFGQDGFVLHLLCLFQKKLIVIQ